MKSLNSRQLISIDEMLFTVYIVSALQHILQVYSNTAKFATITEENLPVIPPILKKIHGNYGRRL